MDSAALAESQLELQEERAALGLSNDPAPAIEVEEVDDWEVRKIYRLTDLVWWASFAATFAAVMDFIPGTDGQAARLSGQISPWSV